MQVQAPLQIFFRNVYINNRNGRYRTESGRLYNRSWRQDTTPNHETFAISVDYACRGRSPGLLGLYRNQSGPRHSSPNHRASSIKLSVSARFHLMCPPLHHGNIFHISRPSAEAAPILKLTR
jgi:hypothetical protein